MCSGALIAKNIKNLSKWKTSTQAAKSLRKEVHQGKFREARLKNIKRVPAHPRNDLKID